MLMLSYPQQLVFASLLLHLAGLCGETAQEACVRVLCIRHAITLSLYVLMLVPPAARPDTPLPC